MKAFHLTLHPPLPAGYLPSPAGHPPLLPPGSTNIQAEPCHSPLSENSSRIANKSLLVSSPAPPNHPPSRRDGDPHELFISEVQDKNLLDLEGGNRSNPLHFQMRFCVTPNLFPITLPVSTSLPLFQIWISPSKGKALECTLQLCLETFQHHF